MRILVAGLRGLPGVEGGVESHAEQLYSRLVKKGVEIEVAVRNNYHPSSAEKTWQGITYRPFWAPKSNGLEAFVHTLIVIVWAAISRPDAIHLHAIGPGLFVPLAKLFGLKVVFTHHGPDYDREKWGALAKWLLQTGERCACVFSNRVIVISTTIQNLIEKKHGTRSTLIANGVPAVEKQIPTEFLQTLNLQPERYVLQVSRLVPEKRQLDLIEAFSKAKLEGWKLVFVGTLKPGDVYADKIISCSHKNPNIVLTGFRSGAQLSELLSNAGIFVLPSMHEGLPIALLEALSYGLRVIASDIPANLEVGLDTETYFQLGDTNQLCAILQSLSTQTINPDQANQTIEWVRKKYNWDDIADDTLLVYKNVLEG